MFRKLTWMSPLAAFAIAVVAVASCASAAKEVIDSVEAEADPDFAVQGEYVADGLGAQVVALGGGEFDVVVYRGGLPGAGWKRGDERFTLKGKRDGDATQLEGGDRKGRIAGGVMTLAQPDGTTVQLKRTERKSPTLGAAPPAGAVVIFDGTSGERFDAPDHYLPDQKAMLSGITTKDAFGDYTLHLEFRLSWMPEARGQGRSNSGVYLHDAYEIQVLDSFGLEGRDNECGGIYSVNAPIVNMCLPPMQWQTYDFEFTAPKYDAQGNKVANARVTVRHNGVVIHDDLELKHGTPGRKGEGPGPRPIHLQGHGNKVLYRNIWLKEKK
mgnify:FL=1